MSNKNIGIKDVAVAAGVSVTTVSHVLNEVPYARVSRGDQGQVSARPPKYSATGPTASRRPFAPNDPA